ncbi:MAG: hypothetical protein EZS28_039721, partial [Streblomastix strix]
ITESRQVTIRNSKFNAVKLSGRAALVLGRFVNVSIIENTNFTGITNTDGYGSALNLEIHTEFGNHILDHVIFQSCSAKYGGAVYVDLGERQAIQSNAEFRTIQFTQCDFLNTITTGIAAVFFKDAGSVVDITKCRFVRNTAPQQQTKDVYFEYEQNLDSMREERFKGSHSNSNTHRVQLCNDATNYDYLLPDFPSDIYVSESIGSDSTGDGSRDNPYRTVQYALEIAEPYSSSINIIIFDGKLWEKAIWLRSRPITIQSQTSLSNQTIGRQSSVDSAFATIGDSSLTFRDLIIGDTGGVISINRGITSSQATVNISNCEFEHNQAGFGGSVQIIGTKTDVYFVYDIFAEGVAHNALINQGFDIFIGIELTLSSWNTLTILRI